MRKLLVWDGDNTLWQGTVLEGDSVGISRDRYELCAELASRGILQSLASANRLEDILPVLLMHGLDNYFLYPQADFGPKSLMLHKIRDALGLARWEDIVFVDDESSNRAEVESNCNGILVIDPSELSTTIENEFTKAGYTPEDRERVRRYKAEQVRAQASTAYTGDYKAFLRSSDLRLNLGVPSAEEMPSVVNLVERSHRFSAIPTDFNIDDLIEAQTGLYKNKLIVGHASDKFGDYGLSCVLLIDASCGLLRMLVVSCRLQGKGIGSCVLGYAINKFGVYLARWERTEFNLAVDELFGWYRFRIAVDGSLASASRLGEPDIVELPDWIALTEAL